MWFKKLNFWSSFIGICMFIAQTALGKETAYWQNLSIQEASLLVHSWSIYSQFGEEGILDEILKRLDLKEGRFVECSDFYDVCVSSVRFLAERGWQGIFIDSSSGLSSAKCYQYMAGLAPILCLEEILYFQDIAHLPNARFIKQSKDALRNSFDQMISSLCPGEEIDILSIDVSGCEDWILEEIQHKPKVIIIKAGIYWSPFFVDKVPSEIAIHGVNQTLPVLISLARKQGYVPVCFTGNLILIRDDLAYLFNEIINDPITLWMDAWCYFLEKQPSYIAWIVEKRASDEYLLRFNFYSVPVID